MTPEQQMMIDAQAAGINPNYIGAVFPETDEDEYHCPWSATTILPQFRILVNVITDGFLNQIVGDDGPLMADYEKELEIHRNRFLNLKAPWTREQYVNNFCLGFISMKCGKFSAKRIIPMIAALQELMYDETLAGN